MGAGVPSDTGEDRETSAGGLVPPPCGITLGLPLNGDYCRYDSWTKRGKTSHNAGDTSLQISPRDGLNHNRITPITTNRDNCITYRKYCWGILYIRRGFERGVNILRKSKPSNKGKTCLRKVNLHRGVPTKTKTMNTKRKG